MQNVPATAFRPALCETPNVDDQQAEAIRQACNAIATGKPIAEGGMRLYGFDDAGGPIRFINGLIAAAGALLDQMEGDRVANINAAQRTLLS